MYGRFLIGFFGGFLELFSDVFSGSDIEVVSGQTSLGYGPVQVGYGPVHVGYGPVH